ncbi:MAG: FliM/FliN family flagellar motor switch protein [Terriglobales bacterium]
MSDDQSKVFQSPIQPDLRPEIQSWFDAWRSCAQSVLSQISGQPHTFGLSPAPFNAADTDLRYTLSATGAVQGEMALRLPVATAIRLARKFLDETMPVGESAESAANAAEAISNDDREALEELLRQIAGLAATALASVIDGEVQLQLTRAEAPWAATADAVTTFHTRDEAGAEIAIEVRLSPALATALAARTAATAPSIAATPSSAPAAPPPEAAGYHRLFDVELGVKLRFGTRRMLLRDVLALSSGLVVELDNPLNSPVDLLLDGRIIARGEVVVIDGKYGLRVSEVVDSAPASAARAV